MKKYRRPRFDDSVWFDALTGLFSKRYFEHQLDKELQRAVRYNHPLSILMLGTIDFQKVIDECGYREGDRVLKELSHVLRESLRIVDVVARFSENEFIILLPETKKAQAAVSAERILKNIRNFDFFKSNLQVKEVSVSIGIAGFPEDSGKLEELVKNVASALTKAKKQGSFKVILYK
jgi:two-component system cell cycle response regulator